MNEAGKKEGGEKGKVGLKSYIEYSKRLRLTALEIHIVFTVVV
jgi:hypothetical protein